MFTEIKKEKMCIHQHRRNELETFVIVISAEIPHCAL